MPPTLTANDLRRLAESADNCENRTPHAVVFDETENRFTVVPTGQLRGRTPIIEIDNTELMPTTPKENVVSNATLCVDGKHLELRTLPTYSLPDCAFWGEAAMRKFVVPYYTREMEPNELAALRAAIDDPTVVALTHTCPSEYNRIPDPRRGLTFHSLRTLTEGEPGWLPDKPVTVFESKTLEDYLRP